MNTEAVTKFMNEMQGENPPALKAHEQRLFEQAMEAHRRLVAATKHLATLEAEMQRLMQDIPHLRGRAQALAEALFTEFNDGRAKGGDT